MGANTVEFVVVGEVDHDFAAAFGGLRDLHFRAQRGAEFLLQCRDLFASRARRGRDWPSSPTTASVRVGRYWQFLH